MSVQIGDWTPLEALRTISRLCVPLLPHQELTLPDRACLVKAALAPGTSLGASFVLDVWYIRPEESATDTVKVDLFVLASGSEVMPGIQYLDTVYDGNGLAWHVFAREARR
jgi:hypothetical protein